MNNCLFDYLPLVVRGFQQEYIPPELLPLRMVSKLIYHHYHMFISLFIIINCNKWSNKIHPLSLSTNFHKLVHSNSPSWFWISPSAINAIGVSINQLQYSSIPSIEIVFFKWIGLCINWTWKHIKIQVKCSQNDGEEKNIQRWRENTAASIRKLWYSKLVYKSTPPSSIKSYNHHRLS